MQNDLIKKITIVGGGTAGWMTAALIAKLTQRKFEIELIESDEIGIIGVGEATIPAIKIFNQLIGIDEREMLRQTMGTYKLGIEFVNWRNHGHSYIHGFGQIGTDLLWLRAHHFFLKYGPQAGVTNLDDLLISVVAARRNKFAHPDAQNPNSPIADIDYAFQFDASLYGRYLRGLAEQWGVKRTEGKIVKVTTKENGFIDKLILENNHAIDGDLFIDCSGQRGLLIAQTMGAKFEDWSKWLLCNRAWAVPCENAPDLTPYTRSTAREAGWQWRIPLQHRIGNGHVFSSEFISEQSAADILLNNLDGKPLAEPRLVKFTPGKRDKVFIKNCVAIGLSSGFLEPLESTSIHLIQTGILRLLALFPASRFSQTDIDEYNKQTNIEYEFIRDFIIAHYKVTDRDDTPFWAYCKNMDIPESLSKRLELFQSSGRFFKLNEELFREESWVQVLIGQGHEINPDPMVAIIPENQGVSYLKDIKEVISDNVNTMQNHDIYLEKFIKN